jgi:hypothetical protein
MTAPWVRDHQVATGRVARSDHFVDLGRRRSDGLLDVHVTGARSDVEDHARVVTDLARRRDDNVRPFAV